VVDQFGVAEDMVRTYVDNPDLQAHVLAAYLPFVQGKAKVAYQQHCPIVELLGPDREGAHLEYKSTLRTSADTGEVVKVLETACIKTVAAFANSREGGTLLIGVADDGSVHGLASDYASLHKEGKDDRALFLLHLGQILVNACGETVAATVSAQIHAVNGGDLCRVHVPPSSFPVEARVVIDHKGQMEKKTAFYVRVGNGTREITDETERQRYVASRWGSGGAR